MEGFQRDHGFAPTQLMAREFRASWRSPTGTVGVVFSVLGLCMTAAVWFGPPGGIRFWLGLLAALFWCVAWLCLRMLLSKRPLLKVGPEGISAFALKESPIAWRNVADIREQTVQNSRTLVITLSPAAARKRWWGGSRTERSIPLVPIHARSRDDAVAAVFDAFTLYGGEQSVLAMKAREEETAAVRAFETRLDEMTPTTWALFLVVGLNVAVWLANLYSGIDAFKPAPAELFRWGANSAAAVVGDGQYWRLLTNTFLHGGMMHLLLNMFGLWEAGRQLNRLYGNGQFLLIYVASALAGSALSLHFSAQQSVSVGASGAVFGVLGAVLVAMVQHRGQIPKQTRQRIYTSQGFFLVYALAQGFTRQGIDNAAHVGGLVCGALLAWLLVEKIDTVASSSRRNAVAVASSMLSAAAVAALVWSTPSPTVHHRQLFAFQTTVKRISPLMTAAETAFQSDARAVRSGTLSEPDFLQAIRTRHLPAYEAIEQQLAPLDMPADDTAGGSLRDLQRSNTLMVELMRMMGTASAGEDAAAQARMQVIGKELQEIQARFAKLAENARNAPKSSRSN